MWICMKTTMMMIMSMVNYCGFPDSIFEVSKDIWQRQGTHFVVEPLKFQWKGNQVAGIGQIENEKIK